MCTIHINAPVDTQLLAQALSVGCRILRDQLVLRQAVHALVAEHGVLQGFLSHHSLCMQTQTHTHQQRHHAVLDLLGGQNPEALRLVVHAVAHEWYVSERLFVVFGLSRNWSENAHNLHAYMSTNLEAEISFRHDDDRRLSKDNVFTNFVDVFFRQVKLSFGFCQNKLVFFSGCLLALCSPLEPDSVSMPKTYTECKEQNDSQYKRTSTKTNACNFFSHVFHNPNRSELQHLVEKSLLSVSSTFFNGHTCAEIEQLQQVLASCSCNDLLIIFLLLLNVDKNLKHTVLVCEVPANAAKLERFLVDLKDDFVVNFFIDDSCSKQCFVARCEEGWVLA